MIQISGGKSALWWEQKCQRDTSSCITIAFTVIITTSSLSSLTIMSIVVYFNNHCHNEHNHEQFLPPPVQQFELKAVVRWKQRWCCPQPCSIFSSRSTLYLAISSLMTGQPEGQGKGIQRSFWREQTSVC